MSSLKTQIVKQLDCLPEQDLKQVADFIESLTSRNFDSDTSVQAEDATWLESDLSNLSEYESYEWQAGELEQGSPVEISLGGEIVIVKNY